MKKNKPRRFSPFANGAALSGSFMLLALTACAQASGPAAEDPIARYTLYLVIATGLLVAATVLLVVAAVLQWLDTRKGLKATETMMERSAMRERAYVFVEVKEEDPNNWIKCTKPFGCEFKLVNYGQTPALIKSIVAAATIANQPAWHNQKSKDLALVKGADPLASVDVMMEEIISPHYVLAKGASSDTYERTSARPVLDSKTCANDPVHKIAVNGPQTMFWVTGEVVYDDIFGKEHMTSFCFGYERNTNYKKPVLVEFRSRKLGNERT